MKAIGKKVNLNFQDEYNAIQMIKRKYTNIFIQTYIHRKEINPYEAIVPTDYDAIVVGSDQIWRYYYLKTIGGARIGFLDFTGSWNIKRIAYAASFGNDLWEFNKKETQIAQRAIRRFNAVSVREKSGLELCRKYLHYMRAIQVLDPTMLLSKDDYIHIVNQSTSIYQPEGNLMDYVLDVTPEKNAYIDTLAKILGMKRFRTNSKCEMSKASLTEIVQPPVEQWLHSFSSASYVVTDSFHACVFSILFHKPFTAIANYERGFSRFHSLLELFGLEERLVTNTSNPLIANKEIDWSLVDEKLMNMRTFSINYLNNSLRYE